MSLFTSPTVGQPKAQEQAPQFQPRWTEGQVRSKLKRYDPNDRFLGQQYHEAFQQHLAYYNIPFYSGEFDLIDAFKHAGAGFFEGFTTFNIMDPADNEYEQIFRNLGHLAGFAPGLLAVPFSGLAKLGVKSAALDGLAKTARMLNDKSIPMAGAKFLTKKAKNIVKPMLNSASTAKAGAAKDALSFLTGNQARHVMEGAFHLGAASAISSWQGGVDEMMSGFMGGAVAGAGFRAIGNIKLAETEAGNKIVRGIAGSLFMGLPATMRGATTSEQVYEYVLGAYFGKGEMPWRDAKTRKFLFEKMPERAKTDKELAITMDPRRHPEFEGLPPEVQKQTIEWAEKGIPGTDFKGYGNPEDNKLLHEFLVGKIDPDKLTEKIVEVEGYEVAVDKAGEVIRDSQGAPTYEPKRGFLSKFLTRMTSGGAEGADRVFAQAMRDVGAPVYNYTFREHQAQAMLNKGTPRKLSKAELEEANTEVMKTSESIDRPVEGMSDYILNLQRRNWHIVKHAQSVYAVAPILRKGENAMRVVDGGTGWGVDMAIRHGKDVYVFDNSSKKKFENTVTNEWYKYDPILDVFQPTEAPPKPPKTWAGIGSREISQKGKDAIKELVNTHFEGKKIKPTDKEIKELQKAEKKKRRLLKPIISILNKEVESLETSIANKEAELSTVTKGDNKELIIKNDIDALRGELDAKIQEREIYLDPDKEFALDVKSGTIVQVKDINPDPKTDDTGPGTSVKPSLTPLLFVRKYLNSLYKTHPDAQSEEYMITQTIAAKMIDFLPKKGQKIENRSEEYANWIENFALTAEKTTIRLDLAARGTLRQWLANEIFNKQLHYFGLFKDKVIDLNKPIDPDDPNPEPPRTASGQLRRTMEPAKLLQKMYEEAGGKIEDIPIGVLDHVTIVDKNGKPMDYNLSRYHEKLARDYQFEGMNPDEARSKAGRDYKALKANIMKQMFERGNTDYDGYYAFSGAADKDRMYMVKFHPKTKEAIDKRLLNEVLRLGDMSKDAMLMQTDFVKDYQGVSGWQQNKLESLFSKSMMSNLLYDMQMNGFKVGNKAEILASAQKMFGTDYQSKGQTRQLKDIFRKYQQEIDKQFIGQPEWAVKALLPDFIRKMTKKFKGKQVIVHATGKQGAFSYPATIKNFYTDMSQKGDNVTGMNLGVEVLTKKGKTPLVHYSDIDATIQTIPKTITKGRKGHWIQNSKGFNKRAQIWFTNGIPGDVEYMRKFRDEKGKKIKLTDDGNVRYALIDDLPKDIKKKMKKDGLYSSDLNRKSTELEENTDGSLIVEERTLKGIVGDSGMGEGNTPYDAQSKSFIVSPDPEYGALLGKYMMHTAGKTMSKYMRDNNVNMLIHTSAAKQMGLRESGDYHISKKGMTIDAPIYELHPSHIYHNYSVISRKEMANWQRVPKQLLGALMDNTKVAFDKGIIKEILQTIVGRRYNGTKNGNLLYDEYISSDITTQKNEINRIIKNLEEISIDRIIDGIRRPGNDIFTQQLYDYMLSQNKKLFSSDYKSGRMSDLEYKQALNQLNGEDAIYRRKLQAAKNWNKKNIDKVGKNAINGMVYDKDVRDYRMQVIKNFVVQEVTRPRMPNSGVGRLRPYDKALRMDLDGLNPNLKKLDKDDTIFFLDNGFKDMKINIGGDKEVTLGDLWEHRKSPMYRKGIDINDIFNALVTRIPMDSVSGAHVLKFKGFTGRNGYGTLIHGKTMKALGGADLDADEAHFFFGGKNGFRKAWKKGFLENKSEYQYHLDKNGKIVKKPVKGGRTVVGDNKSAPIPTEILTKLKLPRLNKDGEPYTYRDLLTLDFEKKKKDLLNSRAAMYSVNERNRISEAAVSGRAQMGASAVTPKQMMQQLHSMLGGGEDGKIISDKIEMTRRVYDDKSNRYKMKKYHIFIKPKTEDYWREYARAVGRAQIAFSSDPMDELGLKSNNMWFKELWNAHFHIVGDNIFHVTDKGFTSKKKVDSSEFDVNDITAWDLKGGTYQTINNLNKAYWGRNYRFNRKYTMDEIRDLGKGIYGLKREQRNSFLINVGEKLQPLDWSDNLIGRLDRKAVLEMYKEININAKDPKWAKLLELMERSSFTVPESKELLQAIWKKSKLLKKWEKNDKGDWIEVDDTFNLWSIERRKFIARNQEIFEEAIDIQTVNKKGKKGLKINQERLDQALGKDPELSREEVKRIRREILSDIAYRAEDFLLNDLYDMATFKNLTRLFNKMTTLEKASIPDLHKFAEDMKSRSWLMARNRKNIAGFDWTTLSPEVYKDILDWMGDKKLTHLIPEHWKTSKDKPSAALDAITIDKEIIKFRKDNNLTDKQAKMLDYLILGTYKRGNLSKLNKIESGLRGYDPVTKDILYHLKQIAAGTSVTRLGYGSKALFSKESMADMVGEVSFAINDVRLQPTKEQILQAQIVAQSMPETVKKESKIDYLEQDVVQDLKLTTGFEGLKQGVEISNVPESMRADALKLVDYVKSENGNFQANFNGVVRSLLGKDINAMHFQDIKVLNNWFADVKGGTLMQRLFNQSGVTPLSKRHHWLFPRTINRELMRDDIKLMEENGLYFTKTGELLKGKLMRPTQNIEIVQKWIQRTMDSASKMSDERTQWLKEKLLFVNSIKDGEVLRQIAVREREAQFYNEIEHKTEDDYMNEREYQARHQDILNNHGDKLQNKYTIDIDGKRYEKTGEQIKDIINERYTEFFTDMHQFITGEKGWMENNKMFVGYWGENKKNKRVDTDKFLRYLLNSWREGKDISSKIGIDNLRYVARSMMIEMAGHNKEFQEILKRKAPKPTDKFPFHTYFPHLHFNKKLAGEGMKKLLKEISERPVNEFEGSTVEEQQKNKNRQLETAMWKHHTLTGEWLTRETEEWMNFEEVLENINNRHGKLGDKINWFKQEPKAGSMYSRLMHIPGWSIDATVPEAYARTLVDTYHKQLSQIFSRSIIDRMYKNMKPKWGHDQSVAWQKFMKLYVQDSIGNPSIVPDHYLTDPTMKLRGTPYAWWSDNNVTKKVNQIMENFGITKDDLPEHMRGVDMQQIRHWSNLEAQYEMASLLAHPKSMVTNIFGGTMHTIESTGFKNWRNSRNVGWLKQNINSKWNSMQDVMDFVVRSGVYPEYMLYEAGLSKEIRSGRNKEFIEDVAKKMTSDPDMKETTLREIGQQYGVKDKVVQFAAKFMTVPERHIRRDAFMAHYIQAWERYGGAIKDPEHPFLIEQAKKGVQATQFLYSAPFRPAFARTALGKVMTRFQLWSWNSVRFRNDVLRQAKIYGLQPGTEAYERYARTMQTDIFVFALANMFAYSLFETALPAPWNWFQDTADWIFGNQEERDRAFFGQWPKQLAPLQMVTPPILRLLPSSMRAIVDDDWSKVGKYYVWTMLPFGRMGRDVLGEGNLIENPIRILEKTTGFPLLQLQKEATNTKEELEEVERIIPSPGSSFF